MAYKDPAEFKAKYDRLHDYWQTAEFYQSRIDYSDILNRRYVFKLDSFLEQYRMGIDIQLPAIEEDRDQHVQIMTLDDPRFDCVSLESSEDAKDDVETNRIWHAASAQRQNKNGRVTKANAQSIVQYGVAINRKDWTMPKEPGPDYYEKKGLKEDDDEGRLSAREGYYKDEADEPFETLPVSPLECCWEPLVNHTRFYQRFVMPYEDAKKTLKNLNGESISLDSLGKLVLLGDPRPVDEDAYETDDIRSKQVEVIVCDEQDPESGKWHCYEYICLEGEDWATQGHLFNDYVNPLGMSRYFVIERGDAPALEVNPHLHYRPILYSEYVLGAELAYLMTMHAVFTRMQLDGRLMYVDVSKMKPAQAQALGWDVMTTNAMGAQSYVAKEIGVGSNILAALPAEVKTWPWPTPEALHFQIEQKQIAFGLARPNRFLTAKYGDAKEPDNTATQYLDQKQAAALPYSSHLSMIAGCWKAMAEAEKNAIIFWEDYEEADDEGTKAQRRSRLKQYRVVTSNDEPLLTNPVDAGTEVIATADTFKRRYTIRVDIKNETQAERMQNNLAADDEYLVKKASTKEQWLKNRGYADPKKQLKDLDREEQRVALAAEMAPIRIANMKKYVSAETQQDLMTPVPPLRSEMMQQPGGGNAPGQMVQAGPAMTPAPVEQPGASVGGI